VAICDEVALLVAAMTLATIAKTIDRIPVKISAI